MWHIRVISIGVLGIFLTLAPGLRADSLQLKNGNFVQGKYLGGTERAVQFEVNGKIRLYDIGEILSISFAAASADGGMPSNNGDQKPSANTEMNSVDKDNGGLRTALKDQVKVRMPQSLRTSLSQNHSATCQQQGTRTSEASRPSCPEPVPNSDSKARVSRVSARSARVLPTVSSIVSD